MTKPNSTRGIPVLWVHTLGAVIVLGMLGTTGYLFWDHFQQTTLRRAQTQVLYSTTRAELDKQSSIADSLGTQAEDLRTRVESLPTLRSPDGYNHLSAEIASLAEESGIRIDVLQPEEQETRGRISWIPIQCIGEGSVDAMLEWLDVLERQWPDIVVESLDISSDESGSVIRLEALFRWYVLADDA